MLNKLFELIRHKNYQLYRRLKKIYGLTVGLHLLKTFYLKKIGFYNGKKYVKLLQERACDDIICDMLNARKPFMLTRYGSTEFRNIIRDDSFDILCLLAGFFPNDITLLKEFRRIYLECSKNIDILAVWNYKNYFKKKKELIRNFSNIEHIAPLSIVDPGKKWIKFLADKKILVIHPFKKTIEYQYQKREKIGMIPEFKKLEVIRAVQTIAMNEDSRFKSWFEALDFMKSEIEQKDFDIALIGCGAYGLPLAAHVKSMGKTAIHIGGALQIFFGIKGKRWERYSDIEFNKYWISPLPEDQVENMFKVENGAYW
ncbi:MAG: hypothetical protein MI975_25845 [Cytophagales bacterium]|nr:hypothetical protein [Cytophagales bacterium]